MTIKSDHQWSCDTIEILLMSRDFLQLDDCGRERKTVDEGEITEGMHNLTLKQLKKYETYFRWITQM